MSHPNVLVFFTDQQRWDCSGLHGNPLDLMPNFDRMAARGLHVANSFTCQPVCGPARACLQTGLYATRSGCYRNGIPLPGDSRTLAHCFRDGGYHTAYIGKWHLANGEGPVRPDQRGGYEEWLASDILEFTSDAYDVTLFNEAEQPIRLPGYRVDALTDAMIRFLDRQRDANRPFFLFTSFVEPHHQNSRDEYPAPEGYAERYRGRWMPPDLAALGGSAHRHLAGYYGMVKRLDEALGRVFDALRSLRLEQNTIVLFTSDHGCHFKTRNDEYKRSCHDSSIRVPTAFAGPGFAGRGRMEQLVSLIDLPPTLLDAAGLPVPAAMQGRSIMNLIRGDSKDHPREVFVQISESQVGRAIRSPRWKYGVWAPDKDGCAQAGSDRYREEFLYDLDSDPYELNNLVGYRSHRQVADELASRLRCRMREAGEEEPIIEPAPEKESGQLLVEQ